MLPLFLLCSPCAATDPAAAFDVPIDTAADVQIQAQNVQLQLTIQTDRLTAIERFLADQARIKAGAAPPGWVQPDLAAYVAPGAPESLIPAAAVP